MLCRVQAAVFPPQFQNLADPQLELVGKQWLIRIRQYAVSRRPYFLPQFRKLADPQLERFGKTAANKD